MEPNYQSYQFFVYCVYRLDPMTGALKRWSRRHNWSTHSRWKAHGVPLRAWGGFKDDLQKLNLTFALDGPLYFNDLKKEYKAAKMPTHYGADEIVQIAKNKIDD